MELWQSAAHWLHQANALPSESPALVPNAQLYDLAIALQDGTVLCIVANKISPMCIKSFHQKPEKMFLKIQNINYFLSACTSTFGLKAGDLFQAEELYYASNFAKVLHTLSLVSKTQLSLLAGLSAFPKAAEAKAPAAAADEGEDIYGALETLVGHSLSLEENAVGMPILLPMAEAEDDEDAAEIYGQLQKMVDDGSGGAGKAEDVYTDILYAKLSEQPIYTVTGTSHDEKRTYVLAELQDTERNYVRLLQMIIGVFVRTLASNSKAVSKLEVATIFSNIEDLLSAHSIFLEHLDEKLASNTGRIVSGCFLDAIKSFKCYGRFCCEIPEAQSTLLELAARPASQKLLEQARVESGQRFGLKDLLNVPMQRVLKYPLLLKELIKHTAESHADKQGLIQAHRAVEDLAKYINDTKKNYDNIKSMISSMKQYNGRAIKTYGALVKDGDLTCRTEPTRDRPKLRYVFLFNNGLILCKAKGPFYHYKAAIDFEANEFEVQDVPSLNGAQEEGKHTFTWILRQKKGSGDINHVFAAKSNAAKKKWLSEMQLQIQSQRDRKSAPPATLPRFATAAVLPSPGPPSPTPSTPSTLASPVSAQPGKRGYEEWVVGGTPTSPMAPSPHGTLAQDPMAATGDEKWFGGRMPRGKADRLLENSANGTFLLRESDSRPGDYSLSVKYNVVKHIKINRRGNKYDIAPDAKPFSSIMELVSYYQQHSLGRHFPGVDTTLERSFRDALAGGGAKQGEATLAVGRARARFAYAARSPDELTFERGVELIIVNMEEADPGWWRGQLPDGKVGIFPANYVQVL
eukprot:m.230841 g.230841  ORF g.230841 m.230841 type:complete len:803 (+) comp12124_c0_seq1:82-2490(+)